jgi:hypothetical protein
LVTRLPVHDRDAIGRNGPTCRVELGGHLLVELFGSLLHLARAG